MKVKKYSEFILELHRITSSSSSSGRTKFIDWVHDDPSVAKSPSAGILLRKELSDIEFDELKSNINAPDWLLRAVQKDPSKANKLMKFKVTMNNLQFLKDKAKEGELRCEYCNKGPLIIYDINPGEITPEMLEDPNLRFNAKFDKKDGATCDHKVPMDRGGDKFNYNNLAVSCYSCNNRKGNMAWEAWEKIIPTLKKY